MLLERCSLKIQGKKDSLVASGFLLRGLFRTLLPTRQQPPEKVTFFQFPPALPGLGFPLQHLLGPGPSDRKDSLLLCGQKLSSRHQTSEHWYWGTRYVCALIFCYLFIFKFPSVWTYIVCKMQSQWTTWKFKFEYNDQVQALSSSSPSSLLELKDKLICQSHFHT